MALPYTDQQLLDILRALADELGRAPSTREMLTRPGLPSPSTYVNRFGSWRAALARLGLQPPREGNTRYTTAEMIAILRDAGNELGRAPSMREFRQLHPDGPDPTSYGHRFESWNAALKAAGLSARRARTPAYTDETLLEILRNLIDNLGRAPTVRELLAHPDHPSPTTYRNHFGSWGAALRAAGLEPNHKKRKGAK
jgi:hypothetical protein